MSEAGIEHEQETTQSNLRLAFVSGALQSQNTSSIFYTPEQDYPQSIAAGDQEIVPCTSLEALQDVPIHAHTSLRDDPNALSKPISDSIDSQSDAEVYNGHSDGLNAEQVFHSTPRRTSSLEALENASIQNHTTLIGEPHIPSVLLPDSVDGASIEHPLDAGEKA